MTDQLLAAIIGGGGLVMSALIALFGVIMGHMFRRMADLDGSYAQLWAARENDALTKRRMGDHIDLLEDHIRTGLPPPPPPRPTGV